LNSSPLWAFSFSSSRVTAVFHEARVPLSEFFGKINLSPHIICKKIKTFTSLNKQEGFAEKENISLLITVLSWRVLFLQKY
jgi:hypothetical protein